MRNHFEIFATNDTMINIERLALSTIFVVLLAVQIHAKARQGCPAGKNSLEKYRNDQCGFLQLICAIFHHV